MERRKHPRTPLSLPVLLRFGHDLAHAHAATLLNFGEGGARVALTPARALQDKIDNAVLSLEVGSLRLVGEVRWNKLNAAKRELEVGVRFAGVRPEDIAALARGGKPPPRSPIPLLLLLVVASWATWLSLDRTAQIAEVSRLKGELGAAEERRESLQRRLRAAEERTRAAHMSAPVATDVPPPPAPPPPLPTPERVNVQPPPAPTSDDPDAPPEPDSRNSP